MTDNADREENPRSQGVNIAIDAPTTIQPLREHVPPVSTHLEEGDKTPPCDDNANPDGGDTATGYRTPGNGCDFTRAQRMPQKINQWNSKDPYRTHFAKEQDPWEGCFKKLQKIDDEMCKGWKEEIDTLLIFAGLFSATVTAFAVESYQWLQESPSDTLARLQLQALLDENHLTLEAKAPTGGAVICINTFWFASLTISLASVVVSILCKQWLNEYQRYGNLTGEQSFLIRDLRYKGLRGWRVPMIISTLPLLLQMALVLFLLGLLVLLWSLDNVVASIVTVIVGSILVFLIGTSLLPSLQYWFPAFDTQCPYKSSQSWLIFLISVAWKPDDSWVGVDLWEATHLNLNNLPSLLRFYELFSNNIDAVRNIYHCLVRASPSQTTEFIRKIKNPPGHRKSPNPFSQPSNTPSQRLRSLRESLRGHFRPDILGSRLKRPRENYQVPHLQNWTESESWSRERALTEFLRQHINMPDPQIFNRYAEHCVRLLDNSRGNWEATENTLYNLQGSIRLAGASIEWDGAVASLLIRSLSSLFTHGRLPNDCITEFWDTILSSLITSHRRRALDHTPYVLLNAIQDWLTRAPDIPTRTVRVSGLATRLWWTYTKDMTRMSPLELEYTQSLTQYVVNFCERDSILRGGDADLIHLRFLRPYVNQPSPRVA